MTCQEFRLYFEDALQRDAERRVADEHLVHCADCARFVEAQGELADGLRLTRESAPAVPASLDAAVLANYRKQIAERPVLANAVLRGRQFAVLCWSAAVVVIALVSGVLLFHGRKAVTIVNRPRLPQSATSSQPADTPAAATRISRPKPLHAAMQRVLRQPSASPVTVLANPLPAGFRSLMYCDELSCGGTLEVIRVQLPDPVSALAAASSSPNGEVFADVLIGPDGIARGIRIVQ